MRRCCVPAIGVLSRDRGNGKRVYGGNTNQRERPTGEEGVPMGTRIRCALKSDVGTASAASDLCTIGAWYGNDMRVSNGRPRDRMYDWSTGGVGHLPALTLPGRRDLVKLQPVRGDFFHLSSETPTFLSGRQFPSLPEQTWSPSWRPSSASFSVRLTQEALSSLRTPCLIRKIGSCCGQLARNGFVPASPTVLLRCSRLGT